MDNLYALRLFRDDILKRVDETEKPVVVAPDVGGVKRARYLADQLGTDLAIIDKRREKANHSEVMNVIGDVAGRSCVIVDDIVDTAGTLCNAASALQGAGATSVTAYISHGVLSHPAVDRVTSSVLEELVVTNSIEATKEVSTCPKIRQISVNSLFARAIEAVNTERSVSRLFDED